MEYIELALLVSGAVVLAIGYRRNHRNLLLSAAGILFLTGTIGNFVPRFEKGFDASPTSAAITR